MGSCLGPDKQNYRRQNIITVGQYRVILQQKIAQGAYGDIWKCKDLKQNSIYAAKQIKLQSPELEQMYNKQIRQLNRLFQVDGVIRILGSIKIRQKQKTYQSGIILTQFYEMSLFDQIKNHVFTIKQILSVTKEILVILKEIHQCDCMHLDIKPENILIDTHATAGHRYKLCDFGSSRTLPIAVRNMNKSQKSKLKQYMQANSTMIYRAPQIIDIQGMATVINGKADIWMLGCIVYLMLFRKHPFQNQGTLAIMTGCHNYPQVPFIRTYQKTQFDSIVQMVKKMICVDQNMRADENTLLELIQQIQN